MASIKGVSVIEGIFCGVSQPWLPINITWRIKKILMLRLYLGPIKYEFLDWDQCISPGFSFNFNLSSMFLSYAFPSISTVGARSARCFSKIPISRAGFPCGSDRRPHTWLFIWDSRSNSLIRLPPLPLLYLIVVIINWHGLCLSTPLSDVGLFSGI